MNVMRGGPGLGSIQAGQGDYFQATKGGGHGDYRLVVFAPASVQEAIDLMEVAFDTADKYRNPVMVVADGMICQMMEPVVLPEMKEYVIDYEKKPWAANGHGAKDKPSRAIINSLYITVEELDSLNERLQATYREIEKNEVRFEAYNMENAEIIVTAFGTVARICKSRHRRPEGRGLQRRAHPAHHALALPVQGAARRRRRAGRQGRARRRAQRRPDAGGREARRERGAEGRFLRPLRQPHADA